MLKANMWPARLLRWVLMLLAGLVLRMDYAAPPPGFVANSPSAEDPAPAGLRPASRRDRRSWDHYRTFLWLHADCERSEALARALQGLGVEGANVYDHQ